MAEQSEQVLSDSTGKIIVTRKKWYKITLADGRELGWTAPHQYSSICGPLPAGEGAAFRYVRPNGNEDYDEYWPERTQGYLKALGLNHTGKILTGYLTFTEENSFALEFCDDVKDAAMFEGRNAPGDRILLLARRGSGTMSLRVEDKTAVRGTPKVRGGTGAWTSLKMPLDCQFVYCGPFWEKHWKF